MASAQQIAPPSDMFAETATIVPERRRYLRYFLWGTLIPLIAWVLAFPIVTMKSYEQWSESQWGPILEFPFETGTPDADVVIFGDSSAFLGVDPKLLNAQLGIHSVVLPSTVGSLPVIGDAPLRAYLAHHKRPRLIVLYFSPWNLDFTHTAPARLYEGEEMMMRHSTPAQIASFTLHHPVEMLSFPLKLYSTFGQTMIRGLLLHQNRAENTIQTLGHEDYKQPFPPLENLCRIPSQYVKQYGDASLRELKQQYETPGTEVMVYLAPVPKCTNSGAIHDHSFADLGAAPPALLPPPDFAGDPFYAHVLPVDVPQSTALLAAALQGELARVAPELLTGKQPAVAGQPSVQAAAQAPR